MYHKVIHIEMCLERCDICMDMVSLNDSKHVIYVCCGKIMHMFCHKNLSASKHLNDNQKYSCLLCRAKNAVAGSKEEIR